MKKSMILTLMMVLFFSMGFIVADYFGYCIQLRREPGGHYQPLAGGMGGDPYPSPRLGDHEKNQGIDGKHP